MKFEIMLKILFELLNKKCVTTSYLARKYEVSQRSIYRYIDSLDMAGVPIYTIRGQHGGFAIVDTYKLSSTFMTKEEFEQTINALTSFNDSLPDKVLESAINKLKSNIKNQYVSMNLSSGNLIIDGGPWGNITGYKIKTNVIQKCINASNQLKIKYHDRNGSISERVINPYFVVFKQGLWYVYAFCNLRNEFRLFKIGRIEHATILDSTFEKVQLNKDELSLNFFENTVCEHVEMEFSDKIASDVEEWIGVENVKKINGINYADVELPYDNGLISKIMSFGNELKVLSPKKLIIDVKTCAEKICENYK